jgi:synaptic vesicle membrane protein VAT-1
MAKNLRLWTHKRTRFYALSRTSKYYLSDLKTLLGMLAAGKIAVPIKAVYGLGQVPDAHKAWANSVGIGTIVIDVQN